MPSNKTQVLITRPEKAGRVLAQQLESIGISAQCQPFFNYLPLANKEKTQQLIEKNPKAIIIFVSVAAVEFAHQTVNFSHWPQNNIFAVGDATKAALKSLGVHAISPKLHTSEGLLALDALNQERIYNQTIIIVRGDGGREHLAQQLNLRGANIHYLESYKKVWLPLTQNHVRQWKNQQINCIVITSNALLESIVHLIKNSDSYWQTTCLWVVASSRIAKRAKQLGLENILDANGANDQAMLSAITSYGKNND